MPQRFFIGFFTNFFWVVRLLYCIKYKASFSKQCNTSNRRARKKNSSEDIFDLIYPQGELKSDDSNFYLEGKEGTFYKPEKILKLFGDVKFSDRNMFFFNTQKGFF